MRPQTNRPESRKGLYKSQTHPPQEAYGMVAAAIYAKVEGINQLSHLIVFSMYVLVKIIQSSSDKDRAKNTRYLKDRSICKAIISHNIAFIPGPFSTPGRCHVGKVPFGWLVSARLKNHQHSRPATQRGTRNGIWP